MAVTEVEYRLDKDISDSEMTECELATIDGTGNATKSERKNGPKADRRRFLLKLMMTSFSYYPHSCCGLLLGSGGPAFLDLIQITNSNVEEGSIFFTAQYLGILVMGTVVGTLYDRFKAEPLMFASICMTAGINIAIPYCSSSMWLMAVVNGLKGATMGIIFTGCGVIVVRVWGKKDGGPYMQALHFAYSVGGVIAPFIMRPFLAPRYEVALNNQTYNETLKVLPHVSGERKTVNNVTMVNYFGDTHVQNGFLIIGLITLTSAFPFLIMILRRYHVTPHYYDQDLAAPAETEQVKAEVSSGGRRLTIPLRAAFLVFIVLYYILIVAVETLFQNYSMTFVVEHLKWTKTKGTQISSVFWGAFSFGRFQGIFTANLLTAWKMLVVDFVFLSGAVIVLLIGAEKSDAVVWICLSVAGVFIASLYATGVSYTQQRIMTITGKIYATFMMSATSGAMINPLILGTLIEKFSPMWFVYLSVIITALCVIVFAILSVMVLKWGKKADPDYEGLLDRAVGKCIADCRRS
ncbi:sodium-dependent glucose transporter 1A-like [Liolophura sinensis]|uniref:sodium-dependent glucose transporter 1A-like n=1 Tax=Liolophura sinensis TaxID=3198878 RepID=UPI0031584C08